MVLPPLFFVLIAASGGFALAQGEVQRPKLGMQNPAAALCEKNGARIEIETLPNGSQRGVCVFPTGERIGEWTYFRNKHRTQN